MPTDYDKLYQEQRHALGQPTQVFVDFFDQYPKQDALVLDLGCGQGRDALFIARRGHRVVGVDLSATGIEQLIADAHAEGLLIEAIVADLRAYEPSGSYDVVLLDRTLHMLAEPERLHVLKQVSRVTRAGGSVLIADEPSNMAAIKAFFQDDAPQWTVQQDTKNFLWLDKGAH